MLWDSRGFSVLFVGEKATESVCSYDFYRESLKESLESMGTDAFRAGRRFGAEGPAGRKSQEKGGMKNAIWQLILVTVERISNIIYGGKLLGRENKRKNRNPLQPNNT